MNKLVVMRRLAVRSPQLRTELLVEFCRALIREHPSSDHIMLSLWAAQKAAEATDEEIDLLKSAVFHEAAQSSWPKGFYP